MHYSIEIPENIGSCIYKLWYADKYIIEKCKNLEVSVTKLMSGLNSFIKNTPHGRNPDNLAYKFFQYVLWNEGNRLHIEIIFVSANPYQLLKREQEELEKGMKDEACMNMEFDAYIPQFTQVNGIGSWVNRGYYLNFCIWKKKRRQQSNTT